MENIRLWDRDPLLQTFGQIQEIRTYYDFLAVDDDPMVLRAITRDLKGRYGAEYRVVRATSGAEALTVLAELVLRNRALALVVSDQRMPGMTGIELLERVLDKTGAIVAGVTPFGSCTVAVIVAAKAPATEKGVSKGILFTPLHMGTNFVCCADG